MLPEDKVMLTTQILSRPRATWRLSSSTSFLLFPLSSQYTCKVLPQTLPDSTPAVLITHPHPLRDSRPPSNKTCNEIITRKKTKSRD